jgi:intein/homing endonuclease
MCDLHKFVGQYILSFDGTNAVWNQIEKFYNQGVKEIISIHLETGEQIKCTMNHPIMTKMGWIQAGNLKTNDQILCIANVDATQKFSKRKKSEQGPEIHTWPSKTKTNN